MEDLRKSETWRVFRIQSELVDDIDDICEILNQHRRICTIELWR